VAAADALPRYDVRTRHSIRVEAPPDRAVAAALAVTAAEAALLRRLFRLRGLRASAGGSIWDAMQVEGFAAYDDATLVAIARPWQPRAQARPPDEFEHFDEPGWAKLAVDFRAVAGELVTETRVLLTDERARRAFRRYWLAIGPFSGLVRRSWLKAAKRRAEATKP
jgi:hypothetical protein